MERAYQFRAETNAVVSSLVGEGMSVTLNEDDSRAVDLLLDRDGTNATSDWETQVFSSTDGLHPRLNRAQAMLQLLDAYVAPEPSIDLVARTMDRIDAADAAKVAAADGAAASHPIA